MITIEKQTGWKRPHPEMICQDISILMKIDEYFFDLENEDFIKYFIKRTGIVITDSSLQPWEKTKEDLNDPNHENFILKSESFEYLNGDMVPLSGNERTTIAKGHKILKGKLQDCWELFLNTNQQNK